LAPWVASEPTVPIPAIPYSAVPSPQHESSLDALMHGRTRARF